MQSYGLDIAASLYTAATGLDMSSDRLMQAGEKGWNLVKAVNVREGFSRTDDRFPDGFFKPLVLDGKTYTMKDYYGKPIDRNAVDKWL